MHKYCGTPVRTLRSIKEVGMYRVAFANWLLSGYRRIQHVLAFDLALVDRFS